MASTQSATSIDRAAVNRTESVGQRFSNVSDAFNSARAPASMAHCRAAFKPDILLYTSTAGDNIIRFEYDSDRDQLHLQRMVVW